MPRVVVGSALTRWLDASGPPSTGKRSYEVEGASVRESLDAVFVREPQLRGYVLDEQGAVRHHVAVFVDGTATQDRQHLSTPVSAATEIYIFQALSGG